MQLKPITPDEFVEQYERLADVFPHIFSSETKKATVFKFVEGFEAEWFQKLVDRIVMGGRGDKIDIGEAVMSEKRARRSAKFAEEVCEASRAWNGITDSGLSDVLKKYRSSSLFAAIQKSRKGEV